VRLALGAVDQVDEVEELAVLDARPVDHHVDAPIFAVDVCSMCVSGCFIPLISDDCRGGSIHPS
jgi:hypothetical protein